MTSIFAWIGATHLKVRDIENVLMADWTLRHQGQGIILRLELGIPLVDQ